MNHSGEVHTYPMKSKQLHDQPASVRGEPGAGFGIGISYIARYRRKTPIDPQLHKYPPRRPGTFDLAIVAADYRH